MFLYCNCLEMPKKTQINEYSYTHLRIYHNIDTITLKNYGIVNLKNPKLCHRILWPWLLGCNDHFPNIL